MKKSNIIFILIVAVLIITPGCIINIKTKQGSDGGVFKSTDFGDTWLQKVFIGIAKKKTVSISDVSISTMAFDPSDSKKIYIGTTASGIYKTSDGGENWKQTGLNSGSFPSIDFDQKTPDILYTVSGGRIFKSIDGGANWQTIYIETRAGQSITSIAVDYYNSSKLYASTSDGAVIKSGDYGNTWAVAAWVGDYIKRIFMYPSDSRIMFLVTKRSGILKTQDSGQNWIQISSNLSKFKGATNINWFIFYKKDPNIIYLATDYGILKSADNGVTWQEIKTLLPSGTPIQLVAVDPNDENKILFAIDNKIHKSINGGMDWSVKVVPTTRRLVSILVDPDNTQNIYLGTLFIKKK